MPSELNSLHAQAAELLEYAAQLDQHADNIGNLAYDTAQVTSTVRDQADWTGQAADGYTTFCDDVVSGLRGIPAPLHGIAQAVRQYAETVGANALAGLDTSDDGSGASDDVDQNTEMLKELWESTEPVRKVLETLMTPMDLAGVDAILYGVLKAVRVPAEILEEVDELIETAELARGTAEAFNALKTAAELAEEEGAKVEAWVAESSKWLEGVADLAPELEWVSRALGGLGLVGDVGTLLSPLDHGVMGTVDRAMALLNGLGLSADMLGLLGGVNSFDWVPIGGEVIIVGTGVFLAGDFLYHHWTGFRDVCNDAGHFAVSVAAKAATIQSSVISTVESWF